jgi:hypothetical protein
VRRRLGVLLQLPGGSAFGLRYCSSEPVARPESHHGQRFPLPIPVRWPMRPFVVVTQHPRGI